MPVRRFCDICDDEIKGGWTYYFIHIDRVNKSEVYKLTELKHDMICDRCMRSIKSHIDTLELKDKYADIEELSKEV